MKKKSLGKKILYIVLGLIFAGILIAGIGYLIKSNKKETETFLTKKPFIQDMEDR